jgi:hypothetical protein
MLVKRAAVADLDAVAPLFDAYRQFYGQRSDLAAARAFLDERLRRDESVIFFAPASLDPQRPVRASRHPSRRRRQAVA